MTQRKTGVFPEKTWGQILCNIRWLQFVDCTSDPAGEIELIAETTGRVLLFLAEPDPKAVLRFWLQPRGSRGGSKFSPRPSFSYEEAADGELAEACDEGIPDVNRLISAVIPGRSVNASRVGTAADYFAFRLIGPVEGLIWTFLILDMAEEWLYDYSSGLIVQQPCRQCSDFNGSTNWNGNALDDDFLRASNSIPPIGEDWYFVESEIRPRHANTYKGDWYAQTHVRNSSDVGRLYWATFTVGTTDHLKEFTVFPGDIFDYTWHIQGTPDQPTCQLQTGARSDVGLNCTGMVGITFCANRVAD